MMSSRFHELKVNAPLFKITTPNRTRKALFFAVVTSYSNFVQVLSVTHTPLPPKLV
jgi:hypothetical protein